MAQTLLPSTELEAVNEMLEAVNEAPVNTLVDTGLVHVATAQSLLRRVSRRVQSRGWQFNTEDEYPLALSVDGYLIPPPNTMTADAASSLTSTLNVTLREGRLYDLDNHTYVFTETKKARLVLMLDFEDLPEPARTYITATAAQAFQTRVLGSEVRDAFLEDERNDAWVILQHAEADAEDANILVDNFDTLNIITRR